VVIPSEERDRSTAADSTRPAVAPYQPDGMLGKFAKDFF